MTEMFLITVNFVAGAVVLWFACEELGEKRRRLWQPSAWIYAAMALAALAIMLDGEPHHPFEVWFNVVVAMHFIRKLWQGHQKREAAKAAQIPETESTTETVNLEKENQNGNNSIEIERRTASANAGKRRGKQHRKQHGSRGKRGNGRNRRRH